MYYGIAGILSLLFCLFFWWGYSGPYRLIADLQSSLWGVNIVNLSVIACWALLYAPLHIVAARVEKRFGAKQDPAIWKRLASLFNFFFEQRPGQLAGIGLIVFAIGAWGWAKSISSGPLTTYSMVQAEKGESPLSHYVRLTDTEIHFDSELSFKRGNSLEFYYPVTSKQGDTNRIHGFVEVSGSTLARQDSNQASSPTSNTATDDARPIIGELVFDGLPGPLRAHLADKNLLAPNYFVVRQGHNPASENTSAGTFASGGALVFVAGIVWANLRKRRANDALVPPAT